MLFHSIIANLRFWSLLPLVHCRLLMDAIGENAGACASYSSRPFASGRLRCRQHRRQRRYLLTGLEARLVPSGNSRLDTSAEEKAQMTRCCVRHCAHVVVPVGVRTGVKR